MFIKSTFFSELSDRWLFFKKFIQNPQEVGSVIPSSTRLTRKMLEPIPWDQTRTIVELGAGTGVFTRAIDEIKRKDCELIVFEKEEEMREQLIDEFRGSGARFFPNAQQLQSDVSKLGIKKVEGVICGLPFANFTQAARLEIIHQIKAILMEEGVFVTFQYSLQMKKLLQQEFDEVSIHFIPLNIPSAFVYVCRMNPEEKMDF